MSVSYQGETGRRYRSRRPFRSAVAQEVVVLSATVICAGLGFGVAKVIAPKYQAETRILIDSRGPDFVNANGGTPPMCCSTMPR